MITECSMSDNVAVEYPDLEFVRPCNLCPHMKRITLGNIRHALETMQHEVRDRSRHRGAGAPRGRAHAGGQVRSCDKGDDMRCDAMRASSSAAASPACSTALELAPHAGPRC